jgi:hypothetical protein
VPVDQRVGQVWTFPTDGRPWRNEVFSDPEAALRAAGLEPEATRSPQRH